MAEPLVQRGLDWLSDFGDFISDAGDALPFDTSVPPRREEVPPGMYDVGTIVRGYQLEWLGEAPNHATPLELHELLLTLDKLTRQLEASISDHAETSVERVVKLGLMGAGLWIVTDKARRGEQRSLQQVETDLKRWRARLDDYIAKVEAVMPEREQDRRSVLWGVTAPLFLGWYGGPSGVEIPVVGQSETFDPARKAPHLIDLGTPYRIANQLGVWLDWNRRRPELLKEDLKNDSKDLGLAFGLGLLGLGVGAAGVHLATRKRS
ncbi:MAG: hypothetical protein ACRBN8_19655 [Nannocystales bacterium]